MRLRSIAGGLLGAVGLAAGANRLLARPDDPPSVPFGTERTYRWRGFDISYVEAGDPTDPDLLCVHGVNAAGSNQEFERVADRLASEFHVIAPDLPGFGRSARPPVTYSGTLYESFVADFAREVADRPICLGSSLGGAYAVAASSTTEFEGFVLVCPTATAMPGQRVWLRSLVRSPVLGEGVFNLLSSRPSLRFFESDHGLYDRERVGPEYLEYKWQTTHQPGARFAPASFIAGFLDSTIDLGAALETFDGPVTLVWGEESDITPLSAGEELAERIDARLIVVAESLLLPHVEHPEAFVDAVLESVRRTAA